MSNHNYEDAIAAVNYIHKFSAAQPKTAIVAGSGLGDIANIIESPKIIDVHDVPKWPASTAPGHSGKIILGRISGRPVILLQGRVHYYEGYSMQEVVFPVRILGMLGVSEYIATNAAGAINTSFLPGEIIAVKDHINLMGANPLRGPNDSRWNTRFPDMSRAYNPKIYEPLGLKTGVYAAFMGPSFETPAEVRMAGLLGADLAGMSTVPEIITANAMGLRCACLSCVANMAAGIDPDHTLTAQEVFDKMEESSGKLAGLLVKLIDNLNQE
ncbi:MAG: purine-nucleoside phosphorylase [Synergistaceae bacterium]|nr:purine-nucleoside phosphorylase [Synergistaceae bacterium]